MLVSGRVFLLTNLTKEAVFVQQSLSKRSSTFYIEVPWRAVSMIEIVLEISQRLTPFWAQYLNEIHSNTLHSGALWSSFDGCRPFKDGFRWCFRYRVWKNVSLQSLQVSRVHKLHEGLLKRKGFKLRWSPLSWDPLQITVYIYIFTIQVNRWTWWISVAASASSWFFWTIFAGVKEPQDVGLLLFLLFGWKNQVRFRKNEQCKKNVTWPS